MLAKCQSGIGIILINFVYSFLSIYTYISRQGFNVMSCVLALSVDLIFTRPETR